MRTHPEANENETFVGNTDCGIEPHLSALQTARLGNQAYDIDGKPLGPSYRPLLIGKSEADAYDRIMMARFNAIRGHNR